jgi:hypothetical protein
MGMVAVAINWLVRLKVAKDRKWTNTGSGRYLLGTDTKLSDNVRIWYQVDLVTAYPLAWSP